MKSLFAKFMDMPVSVRVSAVFLSVVLSVIVVVMAVNVPLLLVGIAFLFGLVVSLIRLLIYFDMESDMKDIYNAVEFSTLRMFAEEQKIAHYNAAHDILLGDAYPYPESQVREIYYDEMQYARNPKAAEILKRYMEAEGVRYINVLKE